MIKWLLAAVVAGITNHDIVVINRTGLPIARIQIDGKTYEGSGPNISDKLFISVTPVKHDMRIVFRGGADVSWPKFDFAGVHEITFERVKNKIDCRAN